jgi:plastocyanin
MSASSAPTRRAQTDVPRSVRRRRTVLAALCAVALAALAACGSSGSTASGTSASSPSSASSAGSGSAAASPAVIAIKDFAFTTPTSVSPGAKITVRNMDSTAHTVTADSGNAFDDAASPGQSTFTAPTKPGSYPFHCSIHPEMHGVLVVA